jgi:hypothetical protein
MPKLTSVAVSLKLPFLGDINGTWEPDETEQRAAWEMYVELVTRVSLVELQPAVCQGLCKMSEPGCSCDVGGIVSLLNLRLRMTA